MKIGLLTYHHSTNNGAMLQAYATVQALHELGHEVILIDMRQPEMKRTGLAGMVVNLVYIKRNFTVCLFKKHYYPPLTRRYYTVEELQAYPPKVDCLIVGSDQVWNPNISREMAMAYFLDFGSETCKRISYASSFGLSEWPGNLAITDEVKKALDRFSVLSVREKVGVDILRESFGKQASLVVDPTMLFSDYNDITGPIPERNEVVCYKLNRTRDFYNNIVKVKGITGLPVRLLNNSFPVKGLKYTYPPSVQEWIRRIGGARFVITDSFHGAVFSILYKRNFAVIRNNNGKDSRLTNLLECLGLQNRVFDSTKDLSEDKSWLLHIDYTDVDNRLAELREKSWNFLKEALQK